MAFNSLDTILDFLQPVNKFVISGDEEYINNQVGMNIDAYEEHFPNISEADLGVGCSDGRGGGGYKDDNDSVDTVRREFYNLFHWHKDVRACRRRKH